MYSLKIGDASDVQHLLSLSRELFIDSIYGRIAPFDTDRVADLYLSSLTKPQSEATTVFLKFKEQYVGFIAMTAQPLSFSEEKVAVELGFFILPGFREYSSLKMIQQAYYYWAKTVGCIALVQGKIKDDLNPETYRLRRLK